MKVAILGYGIEGKSAEKYFATKGANIKIFDKFTEADIDTFHLENYDVVIRTPSVRPRPGWSSATKIFFDKCPCPIVAVTGTKGKGTTSSLIASILRAAGKKTYLIGNIGAPALDILNDLSPSDIVVYEISSFQLWDLEKSPHVAVLTHMDVDHLDIHTDKSEYWAAKANITKYQTTKDFIIYESDNPIVVQIVAATQAQKLTYPTHQFDDVIVKNLHLPGEHNHRNAQAAILAAKCLGVTEENKISKGLSDFHGLPHRLKLIREVNGVKYYDDSYSTIPDTAIAAIYAFTEPKILILGGSSKDSDFTKLAEVIKDTAIKKTILVGIEGEKINTALDAIGYTSIIRLHDVPYHMPDAVEAATKSALPGDVVILSPAAASFDSFKNYSERGESFIKAVEAL